MLKTQYHIVCNTTEYKRLVVLVAALRLAYKGGAVMLYPYDRLPPLFELALIVLVIYSVVSISTLKRKVKHLENVLQTLLPEKQPKSTNNNPDLALTPPNQTEYTSATPSSSVVRATPAPTTIPTSVPTTPQHPAVPQRSAGVPPIPEGFTSKSAFTPESSSSFEPSQKASFSSFENLVGRNIFGFVSAGLVFIGLVLLGMLVVPSLGDVIRCSLMYSLSAVFLVVGFVAVKRQVSAHTIPLATGEINVTKHAPLLPSILLGTGAGGFFISLLITRLYFGYLDNLGVLALLLVWSALCMYLVKRFNSIVLAVVAHAGMIISVCFSYSFGFSDSSIFIIIAYQLLACLIVVGGSLVSMRRVYCLGLLASLVLALIASTYLWHRFDAGEILFSGIFWFVIPIYTAGFRSELPSIVVVLAFFIQFITASFVLYLLRKALMQDQKVSQHTAATPSYVIGEFLWLYMLCTDVYKVLVHLFLSWTHTNLQVSSAFFFQRIMQESITWELDAALGICILVLVLHVGIILLFVQKKGFNAGLSRVAIIAATSVAAILLLISAPHFRWVAFIPSISGLLLVTVVLYALSYAQLDGNYAIAGHVILAVEAVYLLTTGYAQLVPEFGVLGPLVALIATMAPLVWWRHHGYNVDIEAKRVPVLFVLLVFFELSMETIPSINGLFIEQLPLFRLAQLMGLFVFFPGLPQTAFTGFSLLQLQEKSVCSRAWIIAAQINEVVLLSSFIFHISGSPDTNSPARNLFATTIYLLCAVLVLAMIVARVWEHAQKNRRSLAFLQVVWAILFTFLCPAVLNRLGILEELGYAISLIYMICALICIAVGFRLNIRPMRLYGLVVTMLCVLKMVLFDFGDGSTISRIVAFIIGGVLCFAISLLYNYAAKKLLPVTSSDLTNQNLPD